MSLLYPKGPEHVSPDAGKPSLVFKKEMARLILALFGFAIIYLALFTFTVVVAAALAWAGLIVLIGLHNGIGMMLGAGLIVIGLMVFYFIVKFIFVSKKQEQGYTEIKEDQQPQLFAFIRKLSEETGTHFPKHIYLSHDVNAAVFYNSTVKSMFFPVRKNLVIGLGLVNGVNVSEFKAVIAHEFGHFSQKSMRAGSYVYQVNRAIYNMLYENSGYIDLLNQWARMNYIFWLCAKATYSMVEAIQAVQRLAYKMVNKQYNRLSQEMEYHADAIAAITAGSNNVIHALRRIEFTEECYKAVIDKYNIWLADGLKGDNIYAHQTIVAEHIAGQYNLQMFSGMPLLRGMQKHYRYYLRVSVKDEWASHPTQQQREVALNKIGSEGEVIELPAWTLFNNAKALQEQFTNDLYAAVKFEKESVIASDDKVKKAFADSSADFSFPPIYDQYFSHRVISYFDPMVVTNKQSKIDDIGSFFIENSEFTLKRLAIEQDISVLYQIEQNDKVIRSFGFDGNSHSSKYAVTIRATLEHELESIKATMQKNDEDVFRFFLDKTRGGEDKKQDLRNFYKQYFEIQQMTDANAEACNEAMQLLQISLGKTYAESQNWQIATGLVKATEVLTERVQKTECLLSDPVMHYKFTLPQVVADMKQKQFEYMDSNFSIFNQEQLNSLYECVVEFAQWSHNTGFYCQKQLLEMQLQLLN